MTLLRPIERVNTVIRRKDEQTFEAFAKFFNNPGLSYRGLALMLSKTGAFISGGFACNLLHKKPITDDQDMDIFLSVPVVQKSITYSLWEGTVHYYDEKIHIDGVAYNFEAFAVEEIERFLAGYGYQRQSKADYMEELNKKRTQFGDHGLSGFTYDLETDRSGNKVIKEVINFYSTPASELRVQRKIQLVVLYNITTEKMFDTFDFNINKIAIQGYSDQLQFYLDKRMSDEEWESIMAGNMRITDAPAINKRNLHTRLMKYAERGWKLEYRKVCKCCGAEKVKYLSTPQIMRRLDKILAMAAVPQYQPQYEYVDEEMKVEEETILLKEEPNVPIVPKEEPIVPIVPKEEPIVPIVEVAELATEVCSKSKPKPKPKSVAEMVKMWEMGSKGLVEERPKPKPKAKLVLTQHLEAHPWRYFAAEYPSTPPAKEKVPVCPSAPKKQ